MHHHPDTGDRIGQPRAGIATIVTGTIITKAVTMTNVTTGTTGATDAGAATTEVPAALYPDPCIRVQLAVYTYSLAWQMLLNKR